MIVVFLFALYVVYSSCGISVQIDGLIDLGPKFNFGEKTPGTNESRITFQQLPPERQDTRHIYTEDLIKNDKRNISAFANKTTFKFDDHYVDNFPSLFNTQEVRFGKKKKPKPITSKEAKNQELADIRQKLKEIKTSTTKKHKRRRKGKRKKSKLTKEVLSDHENFNIEDGITTKRKRKRHKSRLVTGAVSNEFRARKVKDDTKVYDFTVHIYKQTLKVFDDIRRKTKNVKLKRKVSSLKRSYEERFSNFLRETYNHTLRTNSGSHKVIINTIDTSNKLLQRLINHLLHDMDKEILRTNIGTVNVFQKEVDKERIIESQHACKKLGACRQSDDFTDYVVDILTIILQTDDKKVKQAADALTEALKTDDLNSIFDYDVSVKFKKNIKDCEMWDAFMSRAMFSVLKNIIKNKNKPIVIMNNQDNYLANKTVAFHEILAVMNEKLPKSENEKIWTGVRKDLEDWKENRHNNISIIGDTFINNIIAGMKKMDFETRKKFNNNMRILLSHIK